MIVPAVLSLSGHLWHILNFMISFSLTTLWKITSFLPFMPTIYYNLTHYTFTCLLVDACPLPDIIYVPKEQGLCHYLIDML